MEVFIYDISNAQVKKITQDAPCANNLALNKLMKEQLDIFSFCSVGCVNYADRLILLNVLYYSYVYIHNPSNNLSILNFMTNKHGLQRTTDVGGVNKSHHSC